MKFFLDGRSRVYVDDPQNCKHGKDVPIYHLAKREDGRAMLISAIRCPKSLSSLERAKLKEPK